MNIKELSHILLIERLQEAEADTLLDSNNPLSLPPLSRAGLEVDENSERLNAYYWSNELGVVEANVRLDDLDNAQLQWVWNSSGTWAHLSYREADRIKINVAISETETIPVYFWKTAKLYEMSHTLARGSYFSREERDTKIPRAIAEFYTTNSTVVVIDGEWYDVNDEGIGYCSYYDDYYIIDELTWDDAGDCWYHIESPPAQRINAEETMRARINEYHCGINPEVMPAPTQNQATYKIKGLSQFTIGFEIEKDQVEGSNSTGTTVKEQPLFSHWETDSSCGVEGITNVYNLNDTTRFKQDVLRSNYVDLPTNSSCGGHVNVAFAPNSITDFQLNTHIISKFAGVLYALFAYRLRSSYSRYNKKLKAEHESSSHYAVICKKTGPERYEFRLCSAIEHGEQLIRRYKLFQTICSHMYQSTVNTQDYIQKMHDVNSKLDVKYGERTLYKLLRRDAKCNKAFFKSYTYHRMRFLLHDLTDYLEASYPETKKLLRTVFRAFQFQAWLDNEHLIEMETLDEFLDNDLTPQERDFCPDIPLHHQTNSMQDSYEYDNAKNIIDSLLN
jgi:hypothetical protein